MKDIAYFLEAAGEPEYAAEVLNAHNRLEAFADGLDKAALDCAIKATEEAIKQRDELLAEFAAYKEGSEEAFGAVVAQKQAAEARLQTMQSTIASQQGVICDFREQRDELLAALEGLTGDIQALIGESYGVSGLHMNGDIAPWDELESGGRFERLTHLPCAHAAIARVKGEQ